MSSKRSSVLNYITVFSPLAECNLSGKTFRYYRLNTQRCRDIGGISTQFAYTTWQPQTIVRLWGFVSMDTRRCREWNTLLKATYPPHLRHCGGSLSSRVGLHIARLARHMRSQVRLVHPCTPWQCCSSTMLACSKTCHQTNGPCHWLFYCCGPTTQGLKRRTGPSTNHEEQKPPSQNFSRPRGYLVWGPWSPCGPQR